MRGLWAGCVACGAKWAINRVNYTGTRGTPVKWGVGGLVDSKGRESIEIVRIREVVCIVLLGAQRSRFRSSSRVFIP